MHILMVPSAYPTYDNKNNGIFYKEQAECIAKKVEKIGVIYSETRRITKCDIKKFKYNYFQINKKEENGVSTYRVHGWNLIPLRFEMGVKWWILHMMRLFKKYIKEEGIPDVIHVQSSLYAGIVALEIKRRYNVPYILTEHSSDIMNHKFRKHELKVIRNIYNESSDLIAVSKALKNEMKKYTSKDIKVISNLVQTDKFTISKNAKDFNFITICNLKKDKNVGLLVNAFIKNFKNDKLTKLTIVGEGAERELLQRVINEENLSDRVKFLGSVSKECIPDCLVNKDVFVLPSKYETFGIAYIEALASGIPIITSKCGGPEDYFNDDLGIMIELKDGVEDVEILGNAMKKIKDNYAKYDRQSIRDFAINNFDSHIIVDRITEIYNKAKMES
ncbi:MAG: glycosyltransferase [Clostridium sp.]